MATPFLRWAGSKRQLVPELRTLYPPGKPRYLEPFAGSACLFFSLEPTSAVLGDINAELIGTYVQVRDNPDAVHASLSQYRNSRSVYYTVRATDPSTLSPPEQAARFIYLNRFCFNGLFRTNKAGHFNVPYGGERTGSVPSLTCLREASEVLANAAFISGDFSQVLRRVTSGDFVYLDPPYRVSDRRVFREYDTAAFSRSDLSRLRKWLKRLVERGASFVLSYADSDEGRSLARDFEYQEVGVRRNIAGFAGKRRTATELLITHIS